MKRPLAFFGFTLLSVLLCINLIESTAASICLFILSTTLFICSLFNKKTRQSLYLPVISVAVITGCLLTLIFSSYYENAISFTGENMYVEGEIAEGPDFSRENERYYCVIKVDSINSEKVQTKMRISFSEKDDEIDSDSFVIGDKISFYGTVYQTGSDNSSLRRYYKSQGVYLGAYSLEEVTFRQAKIKPVGYYMDILRDKVTENLLHDFDSDVGAFLVAILTGNKDYMSDSVYEDFIKAGVVHIMAVSGLHLSVWVTFLSLFIDFKGRKGKFMAVFMIAFTVFMMNFACFTGSVRRAAAMTVLHFTGKLFKRKSDSLNSLGFAGICALLPCPYAVFDISFMLSFFSTMGIIVLGIPLGERVTKKIARGEEKVRKLIRPFILTFFISVSVGVFVFPISVFCFSGFSLAAPITNMLFIFTVSPLLVMTGLYSFVRPVALISVCFAVLMKSLSLYMLKVTEIISDFSFSYFYINSPELKILFTLAFIILICAFIFYKYNRFLSNILTLIFSGIFVLSLVADYSSQIEKCRIELFEGCAVVSCSGRGVLIGFEGDLYDEEEVEEYLKEQSIDTDCVIFLSDILTGSQKRIAHNTGADNILTVNGTNVTLFGKIYIEKRENLVLITTDEIKTDIFYREPLQEEDRCAIINSSAYTDGTDNNRFAFSVGEKNPFAVIIKGENIEIRGELNWLNLMKKILKVT